MKSKRTGERLRIEYMSIAKLVRAPRNPKQHHLGALHESLERNGYIAPIIINDATGKIVAGHGRLDALQQLKASGAPAPDRVQVTGKDWLVPVVRGVNFASDADAEAYVIGDNQLTMLGGWDEATLAQMLSDLAAQDSLTGTGFDTDDLDAMLKELGQNGKEGLTDPDAVPPVPATPITKRGDLWQLGEHRVLCGDSTKKEDVERLRQGQHAALCLTDPPYGVGVNYASTDDTEENLEPLIAGFLQLARDAADVVLLTCGVNNQWLYPRPDWTLCWFVPAGIGMGPWGFICWNPVLAYGKDPCYGLANRRDAISQSESSPDVNHPCPKPVALWGWFIERGSRAKNELVFDPFLGSGTTLIAAEKLSRICYGLEIDPGYCDVIVARWEQFTGKKAVREKRK